MSNGMTEASTLLDQSVAQHREADRPTSMERQPPLRILAASALWQGANDYAFVRAFRRAGHSVQVVQAEEFVPSWQSVPLRILRRLLLPVLVADYNRALVETAHQFRPALFFVFKGSYITSETISAIKEMHAIAIQFYPDTGFSDHGHYIPLAVPLYDWVFTTKPSGVDDLSVRYGCQNASFVPHAFDPETHMPVELNGNDREWYECDVSFIGSNSVKKTRTLKYVNDHLHGKRLRIWGRSNWGETLPGLVEPIRNGPVLGTEYAKAIRASKINLGLLFEGGDKAPIGDVITARTFEIPAAGGFMLHERTAEVTQYFKEGKECELFSNQDELMQKIEYYLDHDEEREAIAAAGHQRALRSGYSVDDRVKTVLEKYWELRDVRR